MSSSLYCILSLQFIITNYHSHIVPSTCQLAVTDTRMRFTFRPFRAVSIQLYSFTSAAAGDHIVCRVMMKSGRGEPLKQGEVFEEIVKRIDLPDAVVRYRRGKLLGKGSFGYCYEIRNLESNVKSAVKIIPKQSLTKVKIKAQLVSEIKIHGDLHHENIVRIEQAFEDEQNIYIKMQLCHNKNLNQLLKKRKQLTEQETKYFIHQLAHVLVYLRQHRILHRDLKPNNLFLGHKMEVKVGDFGLAVKIANVHERRRSICGTPHYMAPEILAETPYSYEVDIWSTGIIMYTLLFGRPPFESGSVKETYKLIRHGKLKIPNNDGVSAQAKDLIARMLERDVSRRITPDEMLAHEFFKASLPVMLPTSIFQSPPSEFSYNLSTESLSTDQQTCEIKKLNLLKLVEIISTTSPSSSNSSGKAQSLQSVGAEKMNGNLSTEETDKKTSVKDPISQKSEKFIDEGEKQCEKVRIIRCADYTHRYGFGYLLSNGSVGVIFNDETKMAVDVANENYYYITKTAYKDEILKIQSAKPIRDREIGKKIAIVSHFRNFFLNDIEQQLVGSHPQKQLIYVSKFRKTGHSTLFRLNNKLIHVLFTDKSEIVIACQTENKMLYINPRGEHFYEPLSTALNSKNTELVNRLVHTKELVKSLISNNLPRFR